MGDFALSPLVEEVLQAFTWTLLNIPTMHRLAPTTKNINSTKARKPWLRGLEQNMPQYHPPFPGFQLDSIQVPTLACSEGWLSRNDTSILPPALEKRHNPTD